MAIGPPLGVSLASYIKSSPRLFRMLKPIAGWYVNAARYRQNGFKYDDLLVSERPDVERAISRLTTREQYDRAYRLKRASQADVLHAPLPKELWTKPEEDVRYLVDHVSDVAKEEAERQKWDNLKFARK